MGPIDALFMFVCLPFVLLSWNGFCDAQIRYARTLIEGGISLAGTLFKSRRAFVAS